jgi:GNAT superfamily N-acetyltransferase
MPLDSFSKSATRVEYRVSCADELLAAGVRSLADHQWFEAGLDHSHVPLDPDWDKYRALEKAGVHKTVAAWSGNELAGYVGFIVTPHIHFKTTLHAVAISLFVAPPFRGIGARLIREAEKILARHAAPASIRVLYELMDHVADGRVAMLLERCGYPRIGTVHCKVARHE